MTQVGSLAGFVVTYNRPEILAATLDKIFEQTFPPAKIWIIDNSENELTERYIKSLNNLKLIYHKVGYNAGPAYAINLGFSLVANAGFQWCFWGDDNDPPPSRDCFEIQFDTLRRNESLSTIGMLGIVGHRFNSKNGLLDRVTNEELEDSEAIVVHSIAGGQSKIVNTVLWEKGVRISDKLFYGFEELDFDIQAKNLGYLGLVPTSLYKTQRFRSNTQEEVSVRLLAKDVLWRQYYSTRNLLFIYQKHNLNFAILFLLTRKLLKFPFEFRKGWGFGITSAKYNFLGIWHWIINKYGKQV